MDVFGFLKNKSKVKVYSAEEIDEKFKGIITANEIFPIGSVFIDESVDENGNSTDYSNRFGFTWERTLQGVTPIGVTPEDDDFNKVGNEGGAKTVTLSKENMPNYDLTVIDNGHYHSISLQADGDGNAVGTTTASIGEGDFNTVTSTSKTGITVKSGGSGKAVNNLQPYKVVAYWKRIA